MATVNINFAPQVQGLQIGLANTLAQIDRALDRGDRKAFRMWCGRWESQTARLARLLVAIATGEAR